MAAGWMTALKLLPWGELVAAAPEVVHAARRLLRKSRRTAAPDDALPDALAGKVTLDDVATVVHDLEQRIVLLEQAEREGAALLQAMAEQNARMVGMLDLLRRQGHRQRGWLAGTAAVAIGAMLLALFALLVH